MLQAVVRGWAYQKVSVVRYVLDVRRRRARRWREARVGTRMTARSASVANRDNPSARDICVRPSAMPRERSPATVVPFATVSLNHNCNFKKSLNSPILSPCCKLLIFWSSLLCGSMSSDSTRRKLLHYPCKYLTNVHPHNEWLSEPTIVAMPSVCPSLDHCPLRCEYGLSRDDNGCFMCACSKDHSTDSLHIPDHCQLLTESNCKKSVFDKSCKKIC